MLIDGLRAARLLDREGTFDLGFQDGRVVDVAPVNSQESRGAMYLEAEGRVAVPAFVDAHVHLDKAFMLAALADESPHASLESAIATVARLRSRMSRADVRSNAERAIGCLVRHGVTAARAHVEIDPDFGLELVHLHLALAEQFGRQIQLQLVAFPQRGLEAPGAPELLESALAEGVPIVGGCPYVDSDPRRHLDIVFGAADRRGLPVDLHLDFSDDPRRSLLHLVAERTRALGMAGRVTIGHVTTLAAMEHDAQAAALDLLAQAGISLVVLPATDLYLGGKGDPGSRSLAPIERARAAGVRVAIANNNIDNPFAPFGNGNLLQAAWLAGIMQRAARATDQRALLDGITTVPAAILELPSHGPSMGCRAHLTLLDTHNPDEIVRLAPSVVATVRGGELVHLAAAPRVGR